MNANPNHPAAEQAYTTFTLPARPLELALLLVLAVLVLNTAWDGHHALAPTVAQVRAARRARPGHRTRRHTMIQRRHG